MTREPSEAERRTAARLDRPVEEIMTILDAYDEEVRDVIHEHVEALRARQSETSEETR